MKNRLCVICEDINHPVDEGMKKTIIRMIDGLKKKRDILVTGRNILQSIGNSYNTNKLLLNRSLMSDIKKFHPDAIIYFPEAS